MSEEKKRELPELEVLEAALERERYKKKYGNVLRSTAFSLIVVAAVAVLIAVLLLPVLQISGTSMTDSLQDEDIVVALNSSRYKTGDIIAFYYNNSVLSETLKPLSISIFQLPKLHFHLYFFVTFVIFVPNYKFF